MKTVTLVRFRWSREKDFAALVKCQVISYEDVIKGFIQREILGKNLVSHDAVEPVVGMCHVKFCRKEIFPRYPLSKERKQTNRRLIHQELSRSLYGSQVHFCFEGTRSFGQRARWQQS